MKALRNRGVVVFAMVVGGGGGGPTGAGAPVGPPGAGEFSPPAACTYNSSTARLECPPVDRGHVTVSRSYAFWDAAGNSQDHFDPLTTARANIQTEVQGSRDD